MSGLRSIIGLALLLCACSERRALEVSDVAGVYVHDTCPSIRIENENVVVGEKVMRGEFRVTRMGPLIEVRDAPRFHFTGGRCKLTVLEGKGALLNFDLDGSRAGFELANKDFTAVMTWRRERSER